MNKFSLRSLPVILSLSGSLLLTSQAEAGVGLDATRVVFPAGQKDTSLGVRSLKDTDSFLIQSWVENAEGNKVNSFVITPPLFLMQGKKENTLRIIDNTNNTLPTDRETLYWLNVKAIPSMNKNEEQQNTLQFAITSRIKMFYRPNNLTVAPEEAPNKLTFSHQGNAIQVNNPTPYYLTLVSIKANNSALKDTMVAPMSNLTLSPAISASSISYRTINDFGAQTPVITASIN
ncbi:fimbria/pilus periplasmic chaperone [Rosenbergiella australiborealis]|uniref:fimbria/pilus periplasmic chaperone n=1 Tax=Rosenbergiella australiborealis TaxID=1544696 RepID=UPI001F4E1D67|nr:fimbria/pilus periplasmic chaperone [Rosenbergiella australiborealis]